MKKCDICNGSGLIRLPVMHDMQACEPDYESLKIETGREYSCPECGTGGPISRLHVEQVTQTVRAGTSHEEMVRLQRVAARAAAEKIAEAGMVSTVTRSEGDVLCGQERHRFTLAVVSPHHVANMDERIRANDQEVADRIRARINRKIGHWGCEVGAESVPKSVIRDIVRESAEEVLEEMPDLIERLQ